MWERRVILVGAGLFRMPSKMSSPADDGILVTLTAQDNYQGSVGLTQDM